jgi:hypothetical protein
MPHAPRLRHDAGACFLVAAAKTRLNSAAEGQKKGAGTKTSPDR